MIVKKLLQRCYIELYDPLKKSEAATAVAGRSRAGSRQACCACRLGRRALIIPSQSSTTSAVPGHSLSSNISWVCNSSSRKYVCALPRCQIARSIPCIGLASAMEQRRSVLAAVLLLAAVVCIAGAAAGRVCV